MLAALAVAVSSLLGATMEEAWAGLCKELKQESKCVDSADVEDGGLLLLNLADEPQSEGKIQLGVLNNRLGTTDKVLARTKAKIRGAKGWVVVSASLSIESIGKSEEGSVRCEIVASKKNLSKVIARKPFFDSVAAKNEITRSSVSATMGFQMRKRNLVIRLLCRRLTDGVVSVQGATLSLQHFPTKY